MSFRFRVAALSALAAAVAVAAVSVVTYVLVRGELRDRVDEELVHDATETFKFPIVASSGGQHLQSGGPSTDRGHVGVQTVGDGTAAGGLRKAEAVPSQRPARRQERLRPAGLRQRPDQLSQRAAHRPRQRQGRP